MTDKINEKIINIFTKHKKQLSSVEDEKIIKNEDGFYYVSIIKDENGNYLDRDKLLSKINNHNYIVKIMIDYSDHPCIHNFKIPGEKLNQFLKPYLSGEKEGSIIDIDKYYPDELA